MIETLLIFLTLLQVKHFFVDWVFQTENEVKFKGVYLHPVGMMHSLKHGLATFLISSFLFPVGVAALFTFIDFITHYHIDWIKQQFNLTIQDSKFWVAIGADQMLHQFVYIYLCYSASGVL
jgi:hypothetical protein